MILSTIMKKHAERYPDKLAIVCKDKSLTYKGFNEEINKVANSLLSLGLKRGDVAGVLSFNNVEYCEIVWALAKTGIIYAAINGLASPEANEFQINNTKAKVLFVEEGFNKVIDSIRPRLKTVEKIICIGSPRDYMESFDGWKSKYSSAEPPGVEESRPDDVCAYLSSSGTTGLPKSVIHTYSSVWHACMQGSAFLDLKPDESTYFPEPLSLTTAVWPATTLTLYRGATLYLGDSFDPKTRLEDIYKYKPTKPMSFSTMMPDIINYPGAEKYNTGKFAFWWGSGGLPLVKYTKRCEELFGVKYYVGYCSVEQTPITWIRPEDWEVMDLTRGVLPQGRGIAGGEFKILNEKGEELDPYEVGEIVYRGPNMFKGYLNDPERTKETIKEGWIHGGDIGYIDELGYLYAYGRKEDAIVTEGKLVPPVMLDSVMAEHPAVAECQTIEVPHKELWQAVKCVVVLMPDKKTTSEELIDWCRPRVPPYALPKSIVFVDSLPKGAKGIPKIAEIKERWGKEL